MPAKHKHSSLFNPKLSKKYYSIGPWFGKMQFTDDIML